MHLHTLQGWAGLHTGSVFCKVINRLRQNSALHRMQQLSRVQQHPTYSASQPTGSAVTASAQPAKPKARPPKPTQLRSHFCRMCGGKLELAIPSTEAEWRHVCGSCGYVDYFNPKMVVGCIVEHEGKILLCRRAIEPCCGLWTLPAGYMELSESSVEGAVRETFEEANARVEVVAPYSHFDIPIIGQAYILFRAKLLEPYTFGPGEESLETLLFRPEEIPFEQIAFSSIAVALRHYVEDLQRGKFHIHHGVIDKRPGSGPNDPNSFVLRNHISIPTELPTQSRL
ncbi:hypothetical protein WJX72_002881 [[Myrmecia] bisecta]|uniref:Nudix hydrolase domain-containing protein n=1 Tax=[Myrmecia] bisecta TaxID=41462 RepID=A0AAW1PD24_9CHLO